MYTAVNRASGLAAAVILILVALACVVLAIAAAITYIRRGK